MIISMGDLSEEVLTEADSVRTSLSSLKSRSRTKRSCGALSRQSRFEEDIATE